MTFWCSISPSHGDTDYYLFKGIKKPYNESHPDNYPPSLDEGASFSDGPSLYFWGGYINSHGGPPHPPPHTAWKYDIQSNHWSNSVFTGASLQARLIEGAAAQSTAHKKAYYLDGLVVPEANENLFNTDGAGEYSVNGLLVLDQETQKWSNKSTSDLNEYGTINDGFLNLSEKVGDQGILVTFGGNTHPVEQLQSRLSGKQANKTSQNSMEYISIYDITIDKWHAQQSSGDIPTWRMSGCSVVIPVQDLSSFSIYVFGGMGNTTVMSGGGVYVLSLPSFQWIRVYQGGSLRIKHKCQLAGKHTMLVVEGTVPRDNREYDPLEADCGSYPFENGLGIFDLHSHSWMSNYDAKDDEDYAIGSDISDVIGGGKTGGATATEPKNGFNTTLLRTLFSNSRTTASSIPTTDHTLKKSISKSGIAGATVGAVVGAAAIGGLAFFLVAYKRRKESQESGPDESEEYSEFNHAELHGKTRPVELGTKFDATEMPTDLPPQELEGDNAVEIDTLHVRN